MTAPRTGAVGSPQGLARTSGISKVNGVTPGSGGSGQLAACSACCLVRNTMTGMPVPAAGSSQYALANPGAPFD
jgi:hypothetical protein